MAASHFFFSGVLLSLLLFAGWLLYRRISLIRRMLLPPSVIAGLIGLLIGPEIAGRWTGTSLVPADVFDVWREAPGLLITVVFATLFLGRPLPGLRQSIEMAGPQATFGQTVAWGQYVIGLTLAILVLTPVFGISPMAGALIEIGFEGGHGTASGLAETFDELGFEQGRDLALGIATIGVVLAVTAGSLLVNCRQRGGLDDGAYLSTTSHALPRTGQSRENDGGGSDRVSLVEPMTLQLGLISLAIVIGWLLQQGLVRFEGVMWGGEQGEIQVLRHIPLFPMAMIGGVILQIAIDRTGLQGVARASLLRRIGSTALDLTIAAAIATLGLQVLAENWQVLAILVTAGAAWNIAAFWWLAPRIIHRAPFERGIGDFGQSMGMTVTGLLLMRMADPDNRTRAIESFGYKQLLFEPFVGGGVVTAVSMPLIFSLGAVPMLAISAAIFLAWLLFAWIVFIRKSRPAW